MIKISGHICITYVTFTNISLVYVSRGMNCRLGNSDISCCMQSILVGEQIHDVESHRLVSEYNKHIASCDLSS